MKQITPMSRYKHTLDAFKSVLKNIYRQKILNHGKAQYNPHRNGYGGYSKGVVSDFIEIYAPSYAGTEFTTFAFSYDFLNKGADAHSVIVSIKPKNIAPSWGRAYSNSNEEDEKRYALNEQIISSQAMPASEFNQKLKEVVTQLKACQTINEGTVLNLISSILMGEVLDIDSEVKNTQVELDQALTNLRDKKATLASTLASKQEALAASKKAVQFSLVRTSAYKERLRIQQRLQELEKEIEDKERQYRTEKGIPDLEADIQSLRKDIKKTETEIENQASLFLYDKHNLVKVRVKK